MPFYLERYLKLSRKRGFITTSFTLYLWDFRLIIGGIYHSKLGKRLHLTMGILIKKNNAVFLFKSYINNNFYTIAILECFCVLGLGLMMSKILNLIYSIFPPSYKLSGVTIIYDFSFGLLSNFGLSFNLLNPSI